MADHYAPIEIAESTSPASPDCRCPGCVQAEDELVGTLIEAHAQDKAALARLGFDDADGRERIKARMWDGFKRSDAKVAEKNLNLTSDDRITAHALFCRAGKRALDVLYPPA